MSVAGDTGNHTYGVQLARFGAEVYLGARSQVLRRHCRDHQSIRIHGGCHNLFRNLFRCRTGCIRHPALPAKQGNRRHLSSHCQCQSSRQGMLTRRWIRWIRWRRVREVLWMLMEGIEMEGRRWWYGRHRRRGGTGAPGGTQATILNLSCCCCCLCTALSGQPKLPKCEAGQGDGGSSEHVTPHMLHSGAVNCCVAGPCGHLRCGGYGPGEVHLRLSPPHSGTGNTQPEPEAGQCA
jgi:hypothetical protein